MFIHAKQFCTSVGLAALIITGSGITTASFAQDKTKITVQRFFGSCEPEFGTVTDPLAASGECGIITAMINKFNADSKTTEVEEQIVEWPGYDQLTAQFASRSLPTLVTMHEAVLSDYQSRGLLQPLGKAFADVGIDTSDFTQAATDGVTRDGEIWALPIDNNLIAWHINMNLFKQANLVNADGTPIIPKSTEELYTQAEQFQKATGKPYFVLSLVDQAPGFMRQTYTLLYQQNSKFFDNPAEVDLSGPEVKAAIEWQKQIVDRKLTTENMDYAAATAAFPNGEGGVYIQGTWLLGAYQAESEKEGRPLSNGYYVVPFPQFFSGRDASWTDGHTFAMPKQDLTDAQRASAMEFLKFWSDNSFAWARTGHVPPSKKVFESAEFLNLPQRQSFSTLPTTLIGLPAGVKRQFSINDAFGEEVEAAVSGQKPIDEAIADAQNRMNEILANAQ